MNNEENMKKEYTLEELCNPNIQFKSNPQITLVRGEIDFGFILVKLIRYYNGSTNLISVNPKYASYYAYYLPKGITKEQEQIGTAKRGTNKPMAKKLPTLLKIFNEYYDIKKDEEDKNKDKQSCKYIVYTTQTLPVILKYKIYDIFNKERNEDIQWIENYIRYLNTYLKEKKVNEMDSIDLQDPKTKEFYDDLCK